MAALGHDVRPDSGLTFIDDTAKATGRGRTTVGAGERAKYTAQRKALVEAEYPETRGGVAGGKASGKARSKRTNPDSGFVAESFIDSTAKATGRGRTTVGAGERAKYTAQRKALVEAAYPETRHGGTPGNSGVGRGKRPIKDPDSGSLTFINATAKATGRGRTTIVLDAERGEKIKSTILAGFVALVATCSREGV